MAILSNYVPECLVRAEVSCPVDELFHDAEKSKNFAEKFIQAVNIVKVKPYHAVTHNKGIMNSIDTVVLATGNDFRAVEAGVHAFASRNGSYSSLTSVEIKNRNFYFWIEIPLALGTVGGFTRLHLLVKLVFSVVKSLGQRIDADCGGHGIGPKFCRHQLFGDNWHSRRSYENAPDENSKPIQCHQSRTPTGRGTF